MKYSAEITWRGLLLFTDTFEILCQRSPIKQMTSRPPPGMLNHLKETFTHTPSYDMSPAMLSMLIRMMLAQAQECLFEKTALPGIRNEFHSLMKMAQEAAKVKDSKDTHTQHSHHLGGAL